MGVGVDRVDYTKGILERFLAIERFLEKYPRYQGKFTFVQIGAPSRTHIKRYHDLQAEVEAEAERINWRFQAGQVEADRAAEPAAQPRGNRAYYRAADLCLVTSLHDGMNLVAKEFVAARDDERGVLILSQLHRRRARTARRAARESLRHRPDRRSDSRRLSRWTPKKSNCACSACGRSFGNTTFIAGPGTLIGELCEVRLDNREAASTAFGWLPDRGARDCPQRILLRSSWNPLPGRRGRC